MSNEIISIERLFEVGREYYPEGHFRVEIWDIGVRFCWEIKRGAMNTLNTAFLNIPLNNITESAVRGFLDAETRP
ncbi:hypothetical protein [Serratia marcescens]|uniref:hypothetical protein n=1 Tax=Serratia marcescens TaxID=615 RepID=UPI0010573CEC|nr:hypothetical protein [Serratia marcescens]HBH7559730.1 hypothetical protein [Serratia marcescens]